MLVYRCIYKDELKNIKQNKKCIRKYGSGTNTFGYEEGVEYIHFFLFAESACIYAKRKGGITAIIQCDIPYEILIQFRGCGFYETVIPGYYTPVPEFAIPLEFYNLEYICDFSDYIKPEWARKEDYLEYLDSIPRCYLADYETGGFNKGYNEKSAKDLDWQKYMKKI